ncbi:MAG TPA: phosphomannomutase/phosphoglucomutase [Syntrophales bacterium]|nr:phosphomannomutase/phosphoglucomutase [Syntrophales bacterium]HOM06669.1 phosphomannomutase/phosphoglucomutase [Syntrophales bacterium]HPQ06330.1 phosphomannomutase/phosphoglucomutase [Syntrophales bacterium]
MINPAIFREYDIRGIVGRDLTEDIVTTLGRAIGTQARNLGLRTMTVGRDCRLSSASFAAAMAEGLRKAGIDTVDIGLSTTPMLYFSIRHLATDGGVMVTGSHNPPDFNGFKICIGPDTIYGDEIQELRRIIEGGVYQEGKGRGDEKDIAGAYEDFLVDNVSVREGLRIVVDGGNGTGGLFALPIYRRLGCLVTALYCEPDGRFPHHFPDPTVPENLNDLIAQVDAIKADLGLAFDGDADRLGVVTEKGRILWGDELLILFSRSILAANPGAAIIGEVKCSQKLYDDIAAHGGRPIMWKAGHSLIKGKMKEEKALLAGEMSGHLFFADRYFGYDDAVYASVRLLEIVSRSGKTLSDLLADVPQTVATPEIRVDCPDEVKFSVVAAVRDRLAKEYPVIDIDGVRIPFPDGWGLIRASNTQPVLVLRFEAETEERLREIRAYVEGRLREAARSLDVDK